MVRSGKLLWPALLALLSPWAQAQMPPDITRGEFALLPEYCPDTQGFKYGDATYNTSPRAGYWIGLMGPSFWHMHHYCWALIRVQRASAIGLPAPTRQGHLQAAVSDYRYVIVNATPDFVLLPEVFTRMGEAYASLENYGAAMDAFNRAREIKPDYWPPYLRWSDILIKIGKRKEAKEHIEKILALLPDEPAVQQQYRRLGGDPVAFARSLPSPLPAPTQAVTAAPAASTPQAADAASAVGH